MSNVQKALVVATRAPNLVFALLLLVVAHLFKDLIVNTTNEVLKHVFGQTIADYFYEFLASPVGIPLTVLAFFFGVVFLHAYLRDAHAPSDLPSPEAARLVTWQLLVTAGVIAIMGLLAILIGRSERAVTEIRTARDKAVLEAQTAAEQARGEAKRFQAVAEQAQGEAGKAKAATEHAQEQARELRRKLDEALVDLHPQPARPRPPPTPAEVRAKLAALKELQRSVTSLIDVVTYGKAQRDALSQIDGLFQAQRNVKALHELRQRYDGFTPQLQPFFNRYGSELAELNLSRPPDLTIPIYDLVNLLELFDNRAPPARDRLLKQRACLDFAKALDDLDAWRVTTLDTIGKQLFELERKQSR